MSDAEFYALNHWSIVKWLLLQRNERSPDERKRRKIEGPPAPHCDWAIAKEIFEQDGFSRIARVIYCNEQDPLRDCASLYANLYTLVYVLCCQGGREGLYYCDSIYRFVGEMAEKYAAPPGWYREAFIRVIVNIFTYLDRYYVEKSKKPTIEHMMRERMDASDCSDPETFRLYTIATKAHMKRCFLAWACNEEVMGETHDVGGKARVREERWWSRNILLLT